MKRLQTQFLWLSPSLVLGALGAAQLEACWNGQVQGLLHPTFHPFVLCSGILLVALALFRVIVSEPLELVSPSVADWQKMILGMLLVVAVVVFQKVSPKTGYSSLAFDNRGLVDHAMPIMSSKYNDTAAQGLPPNNQVLDCEVVDLLMAASDADLVKGMEGRKVRFIGQFLPLDDQNFTIVRLMMYCCAADAQPVGLQIKGQASGFQKMDWAKVEGVVHFVPDDKVWKVDFQLDSITPTPTPKEIYLY